MVVAAGDGKRRTPVFCIVRNATVVGADEGALANGARKADAHGVSRDQQWLQTSSGWKRQEV